MTKISGWINLNKPCGISSNNALYTLKRVLNQKKIGHAGTLDPMASGVLPVAIGEATKTIPFATNADKSYEFTIEWGQDTDTLDAEGQITSTCDVVPSTKELENILSEFIGQISQIPPNYSAIKVNGKRSYELARKGENFTLKSRFVTINGLTLISHNNGISTFSVDCGKGTYVRSLARDIIKKFNTCGHVTAIKRTKVGIFSIENTILLDQIDKMAYDAALKKVLPIDVVLVDIPACSVSQGIAQRIRNGQKIKLDLDIHNCEKLQVKHENNLIAIAQYSDNLLSPVRVFNS